MLALLLSTVIGASLIAIAVGMHGRAIDNHPVCRRCGFDLIGIWPDATICSDCGQSLMYCVAGVLIRSLVTGSRHWSKYVAIWCMTGYMSKRMLSSS